jgi:hypothetical protein
MLAKRKAAKVKSRTYHVPCFRFVHLITLMLTSRPLACIEVQYMSPTSGVVVTQHAQVWINKQESATRFRRDRGLRTAGAARQGWASSRSTPGCAQTRSG